MYLPTLAAKTKTRQGWGTRSFIPRVSATPVDDCYKTSVFRSLLSRFATISGHLHSCKSFIIKHLVFRPDGDFCCNLFILFKLRREFAKLGGEVPGGGTDLAASAPFTIVRPRRAISCNGLRRVFPQPLNPAPYSEVSAAPFGCGQGRLEVVPRKKQKCKFNKTKTNGRTPVSSFAGRQRRWGTNLLFYGPR